MGGETSDLSLAESSYHLFNDDDNLSGQNGLHISTVTNHNNEPLKSFQVSRFKQARKEISELGENFSKRYLPKYLFYQKKFDNMLDLDNEDLHYHKDSDMERDVRNSAEFTSNFDERRRPVYGEYESSRVNDDDEMMRNRYKVVEKIPDDKQLRMPKMKIVGIPAPCVRTPPLPRPNTPPPPSLKSIHHSTMYTTSNGSGQEQSKYSVINTPTRSRFSQPFVISNYQTNYPLTRRNVIIHQQSNHHLPPSYLPKLVKQVHIHHYHHTKPALTTRYFY